MEQKIVRKTVMLLLFTTLHSKWKIFSSGFFYYGKQSGNIELLFIQIISKHVLQVYGACQSGLMFSIIDRSMGSYSSECIEKFMALALKCCQDDPNERPTILEVVRELENLCSLLPESDLIPTESDASISGVSGVDPSPLYSGRNSQSQMTTESLGSELVSGEIPTIRPR